MPLRCTGVFAYYGCGKILGRCACTNNQRAQNFLASQIRVGGEKADKKTGRRIVNRVWPSYMRYLGGRRRFTPDNVKTFARIARGDQTTAGIDAFVTAGGTREVYLRDFIRDQLATPDFGDVFNGIYTNPEEIDEATMMIYTLIVGSFFLEDGRMIGERRETVDFVGGLQGRFVGLADAL